MVAPPISQLVTFCYVPDLDTTEAFYHDVLGLPRVLDQGRCRIFQAAPNAFLGFCLATANIPAQTSQGVILTLVVDSTEAVDVWHHALFERGLQQWIERAPTLNETFNIYHLFLRDPAGYLVEIQAFLDPNWPAPWRPAGGLDS